MLKVSVPIRADMVSLPSAKGGRRKVCKPAVDLTIPTAADTEVSMANSSSTATGVAGKSYPFHPHTEAPSLIGGLVHHALVSPSVQVQILSVVDVTGSATVGDIIAELPGHPDPVGAIVVMVRLNILVVEVRGTLDASTVVRRADPEPDPAAVASPPDLPGGVGTVAATATAGAPPIMSSAVPSVLERLETGRFIPEVVTGPGAFRRDFARVEALRRPGIYGLMNATSIYIGMGSDVGARVAGGQQPIENISSIFVITDQNDTLTAIDAEAAERMLWSRAAACPERTLVNSVPDGASVDAERWSELDAFVGQACLALRHHGLFFVSGSARTVLAGPRAEPRRVGPLRPLEAIPKGEVMELSFGDGLVALAVRQSETRWVLLQGSEVRAEVVPSANASVKFLRSAWLHSGLLDASPGGRSYTVTRDLSFRSGSAVAQFCTGSKGKGVADWRPIDPDGGYDPATAALIAA
jgi:hypothetical protein